MEYIRKYYNMPWAKRLVRVRFGSQYAKITGHSGPHLRILIDGFKHTMPVHPLDLKPL